MIRLMMCAYSVQSVKMTGTCSMRYDAMQYVVCGSVDLAALSCGDMDVMFVENG